MNAILINWSGGLDSTACLIKVLEEDEFDRVACCHLVDRWNHVKAFCEKQARRNILPILETTYDRVIPVYESEYHRAEFSQKGVFQAPLWLFHALSSLNLLTDPEHITQFHIGTGLNRDDGDAIYYESLVRLTAMLWPMINRFNKKTPKYYAPFIDKEKSVAVAAIKGFEEKYDEKLLEKTWTCELPIPLKQEFLVGYRPCGVCPVCMERKKWDEKYQKSVDRWQM